MQLTGEAHGPVSFECFGVAYKFTSTFTIFVGFQEHLFAVYRFLPVIIVIT